MPQMAMPEETGQKEDMIHVAPASRLPALEDTGGHGVPKVVQAGQMSLAGETFAQLPKRRPDNAGS